MGISGINIKFMTLLIKFTNLTTSIDLDELSTCFLYKRPGSLCKHINSQSIHGLLVANL